MKRFLSAATLAGFCLLTLTGCFKSDIALTFSEDGTVDGTMIIAVDTTYTDRMGATGSETEGEPGEEMQADLEEMGAAVSAEPYKDEKYTGHRITFTDAPLDVLLDRMNEHAEPDQELALTRDGDDYTFAGTFTLADASGDGDMTKNAEIRFGITLPGTITEANGTITDNTVYWVIPSGEQFEVSATSSTAPGAAPAPGAQAAAADADDKAGMSPLTIGLAAIIGGLALAAAVWFLFVRPRAERDDSDGDERDDSGEPSPAYGSPDPHDGPHDGPQEDSLTNDDDDDDDWANDAYVAPQQQPDPQPVYAAASAQPVQQPRYQPVQPVQPPAAPKPPRPVAPAQPAIPAGWYPTADGGHVRYHDGADWTEHVRPA